MTYQEINDKIHTNYARYLLDTGKTADVYPFKLFLENLIENSNDRCEQRAASRMLNRMHVDELKTRLELGYGFATHHKLEMYGLFIDSSFQGFIENEEDFWQCIYEWMEERRESGFALLSFSGVIARSKIYKMEQVEWQVSLSINDQSLPKEEIDEPVGVL